MFAEDHSVFFNPAEMASTVTLHGVSVAAVFDAAYALGTVGSYGMATTQPTLTLPSASVPAHPVGKAVVANGKSYTVAAHEPDGTGISLLLLELA